MDKLTRKAFHPLALPILLVMASLAPAPGSGAAPGKSRGEGSPVFSVNTENRGTSLDGRPFLVVGIRVSNALVSDAASRELIDHMDVFGSYGINTFSVFFQGSRFGDVRGYNSDASLDPVYAARMGRIIRAAGARGMVVLVGCLYHGNSRGKWEDWGQNEANLAIANTVRWLAKKGLRNVFIDVNNEHMAPFDDGKLIAAGKSVDSRYVIATSGKFTPPNADLSLHHGRPDIPGKYYMESEGTAGKYWGAYSKRKGLYDYINIGVYTKELKKAHVERTRKFLNRGQGFIAASTWLQCPPPGGPNHRPGGMGTREDPGILWWLQEIKSLVGAYQYGKGDRGGRH